MFINTLEQFQIFYYNCVRNIIIIKKYVSLSSFTNTFSISESFGSQESFQAVGLLSLLYPISWINMLFLVDTTSISLNFCAKSENINSRSYHLHKITYKRCYFQLNQEKKKISYAVGQRWAQCSLVWNHYKNKITTRISLNNCAKSSILNSTSYHFAPTWHKKMLLWIKVSKKYSYTIGLGQWWPTRG